MKVLHDMLLPRSGAGAIPWSARILLIVLRPSSCPRFLSAPRRRVYPHVGFSRATRTYGGIAQKLLMVLLTALLDLLLLVNDGAVGVC